MTMDPLHEMDIGQANNRESQLASSCLLKANESREEEKKNERTNDVRRKERNKMRSDRHKREEEIAFRLLQTDNLQLS